MKENIKELVIDWFEHIAQMADDRKTLNGKVMSDSDTLDEIKCKAKDCIEYISKFVESINEEKLDELAEKTHPLRYNSFNEADDEDVAFQEGFKAGYRKAMEE